MIRLLWHTHAARPASRFGIWSRRGDRGRPPQTPSPYFSGETDESLRDQFVYYGEHELYAIRYRNWKVHFHGRLHPQHHAATFGEFPPGQAPANFNPQEMLGSVLNAAAKGIGNT